MKEKLSDRRKRGYTIENEDAKYTGLAPAQLIINLNNENPQTRTSVARILGRQKYLPAVPSLCARLAIEKSLYSKIALQEALVNIGEPALHELTRLIARIGNNQHKKLPENIFAKWNYPLPRDIAVRIISKIGKPALKYLQEIYQRADLDIRSEIIDGIGHISFYSKDSTSLNLLIDDFEKNTPLIKWKIIRALSAFPEGKSIDLLSDQICNYEYPELRWEAARSLALIGKCQM